MGERNPEVGHEFAMEKIGFFYVVSLKAIPEIAMATRLCSKKCHGKEIQMNRMNITQKIRTDKYHGRCIFKTCHAKNKFVFF